MLLIRLDCKFEEEEGGGVSLTTDNILHYLGIIEERTNEIISKYQNMKKRSNSKEADEGLGARPIGGTTSGAPRVFVPRLLDFHSSDDESCDQDTSSLMPVHRSEINYNKIAKRASAIGSMPRRKTMGRRGSSMFVPNRGRSTMMSS